MNRNMTENAQKVMREYKFYSSFFGDPITAIPQKEMKRLCEYVAKLEAENNTLRERIRELEIVEESLGRNIADTAFCPLCLLKDCPQYHKGDLGMGAFDPESVDREQCKKSILAHAEKGAKEFVNGQRTS